MTTTTRNVPCLTTDDGLSFDLVARGLLALAGDEFVSAGVWVHPESQCYKLSAGNDTVLFDINTFTARMLTEDLTAPFFAARLQELRMTVSDRMRWLVEVNSILIEHSATNAFASYIVADDHLTIEVDFAPGGLPQDYFHIHNGAVEVWKLSASEAARMISGLVEARKMAAAA